jgi:hypothetical protein
MVVYGPSRHARPTNEPRLGFVGRDTNPQALLRKPLGSPFGQFSIAWLGALARRVDGRYGTLALTAFLPRPCHRVAKLEV